MRTAPLEGVRLARISMTLLFSDLQLRSELLDALTREGYENPTPIQAKAIPPSLEGRNLLGLAQTGTGKTAAFLLPILQRLSQEPHQGREPRALILAPTRELALQIAANAKIYGRFVRVPHVVIVGGVSQERQVNDLKRGADIVIATPGRLVDLMEQRLINLSKVEVFVFDEADRMLEIGFLPSVKQIAKALPYERQTLFFSATMPAAVADLAKTLLQDPVRVEVTPAATPVDRIQQSVIFAQGNEKRQILVDLLADAALERVIIFTRTKHGADRVAKILDKLEITTGAMHGRKSQSQRQAVLRAFSDGRIRVLVATDIAARGIDIDNVTHVINFEIPNEPESYVHRIGRTARAGKTGIAIALCDSEERTYLRDIERLTRHKLAVVDRPPHCGIIVPQPQKSDYPADEKGPYRGGPRQGARPARPAAEGGAGGRPQGKKPHRGQAPRKPYGEGTPAEAQDRAPRSGDNQNTQRPAGEGTSYRQGPKPARKPSGQGPARAGGYGKSQGQGSQRSGQRQGQGAARARTR